MTDLTDSWRRGCAGASVKQEVPENKPTVATVAEWRSRGDAHAGEDEEEHEEEEA